jgi:hypothetical protein
MTFQIRRSARYLVAAAIICAAPALWGQGTLADYRRAQGLEEKARDLVVNTPGAVTWIGDSDRFWYPKSVRGGTEFVLADAGTGTKKPAFDHDKLAAGISATMGHPYKGLALPFAPAPAGRGGGGRASTTTTAPMEKSRFALAPPAPCTPAR